MENSMEVPKKAKNRAIMIQESLSWAYTQTKLQFKKMHAPLCSQQHYSQ